LTPERSNSQQPPHILSCATFLTSVSFNLLASIHA
jgi:hypothetical protein